MSEIHSWWYLLLYGICGKHLRVLFAQQSFPIWQLYLLSVGEQAPFSAHVFQVKWTKSSDHGHGPVTLGQLLRAKFSCVLCFVVGKSHDLGRQEFVLALSLALLGEKPLVCLGVAKLIDLRVPNDWQSSFTTAGRPNPRMKASQRKARLKGRS